MPVNGRIRLSLALVIFALAPYGKAKAMMSAADRNFLVPHSGAQTTQAHYRRSPWVAPYHVSHRYRGGPGARMGLVAQGIVAPPYHSYYSYPGFYWNNYYFYPNYRMIYDF